MRKVVLVMEEAQDTAAQWQSAAKAETTMSFTTGLTHGTNTHCGAEQE